MASAGRGPKFASTTGADTIACSHDISMKRARIAERKVRLNA
jgi:hypothetical protein